MPSTSSEKALQERGYVAASNSALVASKTISQFSNWSSAGAGAALLVMLAGHKDLSIAAGPNLYRACMLLLCVAVTIGALIRWRALQMEAADSVAEASRAWGGPPSPEEWQAFADAIVSCHERHMRWWVRRKLTEAPQTLVAGAAWLTGMVNFQLRMLILQLAVVVSVGAILAVSISSEALPRI